MKCDHHLLLIEHVDVSENSGTPKSSNLMSFPLFISPSILGYPNFWKHPCGNKRQSSSIIEPNPMMLFYLHRPTLLCWDRRPKQRWYRSLEETHGISNKKPTIHDRLKHIKYIYIYQAFYFIFKCMTSKTVNYSNVSFPVCIIQIAMQDSAVLLYCKVSDGLDDG